MARKKDSMPKKYKWEVKGLSEDKPFGLAAKMILQQRLKSTVAAVKKFFEEENVENLHQIRIALRRLRYNMEIFYTCFDKEIFTAFYLLVEELQDMTGSKRDIDVLIENIKKLYSDINNSKAATIIEKIDEKNNNIKDALVLGLMKFIHSRELKDFRKIIS